MTAVARLSAPLCITRQQWPENTVPVVSILCLAYNHEHYIRQCLDGLLLQETTFPVEIVIHDDASNDGTQNVIADYAARHPGLFATILQSRNQFSLGRTPSSLALPSARGQFIATCEGDDYWTLPSKLQQQVEILERHPECLLCGGRTAVLRDGRPTPYRIDPAQEPELLERLGPEEMLKGLWSLRTVSRMARRALWEGYFQATSGAPRADCDYVFMLYCLAATNLKPGSIRCLDDVVGCYRENAAGIWFARAHEDRLRFTIATLEYALQHFNFGQHENLVEWVLLANLAQLSPPSGSRFRYHLRHLQFFARRLRRRTARLFSLASAAALPHSQR